MKNFFCCFRGLEISFFRSHENIPYFATIQFCLSLFSASPLYFPLSYGIMVMYQHFALVNLLNESLVHSLIVYWNYTFWWEFTESLCVYFQYLRLFTLVHYGVMIVILQFSMVLCHKRPDWSYAVAYLFYLSFSVTVVLGLPSINAWKLIVQQPSNIKLFYTIQRIEIPTAVVHTIFNNIVIDGHFQCALPLQCLPASLTSKEAQKSYAAWNQIWTMYLPILFFIYRKFFQSITIVNKFTTDNTLHYIERQVFNQICTRITFQYSENWE